MTQIFKKLLARFKKPPVVQDEPNPWLEIEHPHDWLPANNGTERVCGMCGLRRLPKHGE